MSKYFRKILVMLFIVFIGSTTFGLSYFYFANNQSVESKIEGNNLRMDDIEENYDFGKSSQSKEGKTYTIYFFPSASYMYLYDQYLTNSTTVRPEDEFGYKEPTYNEDGSLKTDASGNVIYKLSENTGEYAGTFNTDLSYGDITYDGAYRRFMGQKFSCSSFEADGGQAYGTYNSSSEWPYSTVAGDPYTAMTAYSQSQNYLNNNGKFIRTWGLPSKYEAFTIFNEDSSNNQNDPDRVEHFNGRNQYSCDRLGSWGDCYYYGKTIRDGNDDAFTGEGVIYGESTLQNTDSALDMNDTNTGRYLPIKLTVTNELMSSIVEKVIPEVFTSMGTLLRNTSYTYRYMHNYTFTEWTYVKNPDDSSKREYPYSPNANTDEHGENNVGEAFQPQPASTYFDMLTDLDKYADSEGVIRLFPLFSNGKKSSVSSEDVSNYTKGGGSSQKLKITEGSDDTAATEYKYPFFNSDVYNDGTGNFTYDDNGTSTEVELLKSSYIRMFSYNNIKVTSSTTSSLEFSANNVQDKPTGWLTTTADGKTTLQWTKLYTLNSTYIKDNLIDKYGEGLYTFYVFVANYSYQNGNTTELKNTFDAFYNNIVSQAMEGKFSSLTGKRLIQVTAIDSEYGSDSDYRCSPTVVAFEKIDEPKLMSSSSEPSDVASFVSSNYAGGRSLWRNVNPLYKGVKEGNSYKTEGDDLNSSSPYTYLVKNVDLTSNPYFVISFNSSTTATNAFNTSDDDMEYDYLISNPGSTTDIDEDSVFTKPFSNYIDVVSTSTQTVFKLKKDCEDVYDILVKYNTSKGKYDLYMRRHSKLFCYVFDADLTVSTSDGFVDHGFDSSTYKTSGNQTLLFGKDYSEGSSLTSADTSTTADSGLTLDECLRNKIGGSKTYSDASLLNYVLIDRVTGEVVARYEASTDDSENTTYSLKCTLTMEKNHILYLSNIA